LLKRNCCKDQKKKEENLKKIYQFLLPFHPKIPEFVITSPANSF